MASKRTGNGLRYPLGWVVLVRPRLFVRSFGLGPKSPAQRMRYTLFAYPSPRSSNSASSSSGSLVSCMKDDMVWHLSWGCMPQPEGDRACDSPGGGHAARSSQDTGAVHDEGGVLWRESTSCNSNIVPQVHAMGCLPCWRLHVEGLEKMHTTVIASLIPVERQSH